MFEPWQLAMIEDAGYNGIRDEHIERVAESLRSTGLTEIDRSTFDYHCHKCGIDPNNFTQTDLERLKEKLNGQVTRMCKEKIDYIDFEDFVNNAGVKESTIKRRYKKIPGIIKTKKGFRVISGTRYPYNIGNTNIEDSASKRFTLLKAISKYKYISHRELRLEPSQFKNMLRDLLSAELIQANNLSNRYGANAYDCTPLGDEFIKRTDKNAKSELINTISAAAGTFTGAVLSQIFDFAA